MSVFEKIGWEDWVVFVRLVIRVSGGFFVQSNFQQITQTALLEY
jgi:hypothetical protein